MKKMKKKLFILLTVFVMTIGCFSAGQGREELFLANAQFCLYVPEARGSIYHEIMNNSDYPAWIIEQVLLDNGVFLDKIDELKAAGKISQSYTPPGTVTTAPQEPQTPQPEAPKPTPKPEEFSVKDCLEFAGWARQNVNVREGASTTYNRVLTLRTDDEVTVTGKAKNVTSDTEWYRIVTKDGVEGYVNSKFIIAGDVIETETPETDTVMETEAVSEVLTEEVSIVEEISTESISEEASTEFVSEEEPSSEEVVVVQDNTSDMMIPAVVGCILLIGGGAFILSKKRK